MSVLIKGMNMPESCYDCPMCYDMMECTVGTPRIGFWKKEMQAEPFDFCAERHPRCPLVPAADVVPVRHGRLLNPNPYGECSVCGCLIDIRDSYNYCPNCGAKMDLKESREKGNNG